MAAEAGYSETRRTVLVAGGANLVVTAAKLAAGILTGSSAMLAKTAKTSPTTSTGG